MDAQKKPPLDLCELGLIAHDSTKKNVPTESPRSNIYKKRTNISTESENTEDLHSMVNEQRSAEDIYKYISNLRRSHTMDT